MNTLEKFLGTIDFEKVPPPRWDAFGFWESTVERWRTEGLPEDVHPVTFFGQEGLYRVPLNMGITSSPFAPPFERQVLAEDVEMVTYRDGSGIIKRERKTEAEKSMPQFIEFPVKNRDDWDALKWRLDPDSPDYYPDWTETHAIYQAREVPVFAYICGAYGLPRNLFGEEHLAYAYYDQPDLLHNIARHWLDFNTRMLSNILDNVKPDCVFIWEDMAFKNGPLISPAMFREFMLPYYKEFIQHTRALGVKSIMVDSDGDNRVLLDMFIESGVDIFIPLEIAANMEPIPLREKYGKSLVFWGGIDKRALSKDLDTIEREVMSKVPKLIEYGGYIPSVDHSVPPDVPFANYAHFVKLIRDICEG